MRARQHHRSVLVMGIGILLIVLIAGCTSTQKKTYHVGILSGLDFFAPTADGFKQKMTELGYAEGTDIVYDVQHTNFDPATEQQILNTFVAQKVDLIVTFPTEVSLAAKSAAAGSGIPVVFANANIEGINLVDSVRQPGGDISGVRFPGPDLALKRFETLLELAPNAKRIWIPYQRGYPIVPPQLEVLRPLAQEKGITLIEVPADTGSDLAADLAARPNGSIDAILIIAEPIGVTPSAVIVFSAYAHDHRIPFGGALTSIGDHASLFGISTQNIEVGKQAAIIADKILKGVPAGTIPVSSAESFLQINYTAAQQLGITPSEGLLSRANEIVR